MGVTEYIGYQMWLAKASEWKDRSVKLYNPGKQIILKLSTAEVRDDKSER